MGPITQIIYYFIIINFLSLRDIEIIKVYNYSILIFNLLPIYPLDGGKLINILLSYIFSYKNSYIITMIISFIISILILFISITNTFNLTFNLFLMISLIITKLIEEYRKRKYYFNKFKLERFLKNYKFKRIKTINNVDNMMRDKRHLIKINHKYYTEKEVLRKRYDLQK